MTSPATKPEYQLNSVNIPKPTQKIDIENQTRTSRVSARILVIIVTWNKQDYVLDLLKSLDSLDYPNELIDTLVIDNASDDDTVSTITKDFPSVNLICNEENTGGTGGFNTGLQWAFNQEEGKYQYLWLLDNDVLVHHGALIELVTLLDTNQDAAIAGSTMMQLDYPWVVNEMGCFVNLNNGHLELNRHREHVKPWMGQSVYSLLGKDLNLSDHLMHCHDHMDVDYVAAASLLIRADVAKKTGLWKDFFIHFDDVEWCLRIQAKGHRILTSARSLIWHLSAAAKIPSWVLYYDNRNVLVMLEAHGASKATIRATISKILLKAGYYALLGKADLSLLHKQAVDDYLQHRLGKKPITLEYQYQSNDSFSKILDDSNIKTILFGAVNLQAVNIQTILIKARLKRPELRYVFAHESHQTPSAQLPRPEFQSLPKNRLKRWWTLWRLRGDFDLVVQSDYHPYLSISWISKKIVFINDEGVSLRPAPKLKDVWRAGKWYLRWKLHLH